MIINNLSENLEYITMEWIGQMINNSNELASVKKVPNLIM